MITIYFALPWVYYVSVSVTYSFDLQPYKDRGKNIRSTEVRELELRCVNNSGTLKGLVKSRQDKICPADEDYRELSMPQLELWVKN